MNKGSIIFENIIIYLGIYFFSSLLVTGIMIMFIGSIDYNIITLVSSILIVACLLLLFKNRKINFYSHCSFRRISFIKILLLIFMGLIFNIVSELMNFILELYKYFPDYYNYQNFFNKIGNYKEDFILVFLSVVIVAPIVEEIIFRGLILNELREGVSLYTAIILESTIFAIMHGSIYQGFYAFLSGIFLSVMFYLTKSIWAPIIIHMSSNLSGLLGELLYNITYNTTKVESILYFFIGCILLIITIRYFYDDRVKYF
jgi:hypothetical protein